MRMFKRVLGCAVVMFLMSCGDEPVDSFTATQHLVGGAQVADGDWSSAIYWATNQGGACSGSVVSSTHILTAAHCVQAFDTSRMVMLGQLRGGLVGQAIGLTNDKVLDANASLSTLSIASVEMHPSWVSTCQTGCPYNQAMLAPFPPDLAVIEVNGTIPNRFARAKVLTGAVLPGVPVSIMGYGCENGVGMARGNTARLKSFDTRSANAQAVVHVSSFVSRHQRSLYERGYIITPGQDLYQEASLCPGDSGGPLYLTDTSQGEVVVGVNAYYSFRNLSGGISTTNGHTRLGRDNPQGTTSWLQSKLPSSSFIAQAPTGDPAMFGLVESYDMVVGGTHGADDLMGLGASEHLTGFAGDDMIGGGAGDDLIEGGMGGDLLDGGPGHDVLIGGEGDDTLDGGLGEDVLMGGSGPDVYLFQPDGGHDLVWGDLEGQNRVMCLGFDMPPEVYRQGNDWIIMSHDRSASLRVMNSTMVSFYGCERVALSLPGF